MDHIDEKLKEANELREKLDNMISDTNLPIDTKVKMQMIAVELIGCMHYVSGAIGHK